MARSTHNSGLQEPESSSQEEWHATSVESIRGLTHDEKFAFMEEAMSAVAEIFKKGPQKMMSEMMPVCMNVMRSKGMDMHAMRDMMKTMTG